MKSRRISFLYHLIVMFIGIGVLLSLGFMGDDVKSNKKKTPKLFKITNTTQGGKHGDSYRLNINNVNMPMDRTGVIADVNIPSSEPGVGGAGGKFGGQVFLFSSGFFLSGISNGTMFANAVASASLVNDYIPGTVESPNDPNAVVYVVKALDEHFGESWQDWKDAVALGADFYDGDGDGIYDPIDKNGNNVWDLDEDSPDLLGDETVWCVYNDGVPAPQRRWNAVDPLGIEIRQTVFALNSKGPIGNIIFLRYRIKYVGLGAANESDKLDDVYFGVWADPDLGEHTDDRVGSDTLRNAGYTYNADGSDNLYRNTPPAFFIDFFQGPLEYIPGVTFTDNDGDGLYNSEVDVPIDTAYSVRGRRKNPEGPVPFPGARNQPLSSFVLYINGDRDLSDPENHEEARNYILGTTSSGQVPDPCTFAFGEVVGVDCEAVNPRYWFSGDPVPPASGWLSTIAVDVRQMSNTGPFTLYKDTEENREAGREIEKEIVVAYVVGQGGDNLSSVAVTRNIDDIAQTLFDNNFPSLPAPPPIAYEVKTGADFIDITWPTRANLTYSAADTVLDVRRWIQGFYITAYKTSIKGETIDGIINATELANYTLNNRIKNIYSVASNGGQDLRRPVATTVNLLDSAVFADPETGRIRYRLTQDPFTNSPLVKGKEYYFALTQFTLNHNAIVHRDSLNRNGTEIYGPTGDYLDLSGTAVEEFETPVIRVTFGEDAHYPADPVNGIQTVGASSGLMQYDVINKEAITGDKYKISFISDSSTAKYSAFWKLENLNTGSVIRDSVKSYLYGLNTTVNDIVTEGFLVRLSNEKPQIAVRPEYQTQTQWIDPSRSVFHYLSSDIDQSSKLRNIGGQLFDYNSNFVRADRLRRVEIRFGVTQKAYRYLNGYYRRTPTSVNPDPRFFKYAESVTSADTTLHDQVLLNGQWDTANNRAMGYVDVPFQVWVDDPEFGELRQMAIGFIEKSTVLRGNPDGQWDPGTNLIDTGEYIFIFDEPYDPNGNQVIYKGGPYIHSAAGYADINGATENNGAFYIIPPDANISQRERLIAQSSFFNTLYALGIYKSSPEATYSAGDKIVLNVTNYPYTDKDVFEFETRENGALTAEQEKELFEKVNVFPNPLYGYNVATSYTNSPADEPFVTFSNLPENVTIKIFTLSGTQIRTLGTDDKTNPTSPFIQWDLQNEEGLRAASGLYLAIVSSPGLGEKVLKFSIIMPQKQLPRY